MTDTKHLLTLDKTDIEMRDRSSIKLWRKRTWDRFRLREFLIRILTILVNLGTFPYYRIFQFNTLRPIKLIAEYTTQPTQYKKLLFHLRRWRNRKLAELQFISVACAILAAAVIGSFSWNAISDAYWLTSAFWYSSLVLSILGILLSAQQVTVLDLLGEPPTKADYSHSSEVNVRRFLPLILTEKRKRGSFTESLDDSNRIGDWRPRWKMVFTWQCPIMFLSYSVCFFLAGLTMFVCTPLIRGDGWSTNSNVAVVYLATAGIAGATFMFCSFWIYHYIDLEHDPEDTIEEEMEPRESRQLREAPFLRLSANARDIPDTRTTRSKLKESPY